MTKKQRLTLSALAVLSDEEHPLPITDRVSVSRLRRMEKLGWVYKRVVKYPGYPDRVGWGVTDRGRWALEVK